MIRTLYRYLLILLALYYCAGANAAIPSEERNALIKLYNSTDGVHWTDNSGWLGSVGTECNWKGINCDNDEHVVDIILQDNGLKGTLPKELGEFERLERLALTSSQLSGNIPGELGKLKRLKLLYLFRNQLNGSIPDELGQLKLLVDLEFAENQLRGSIPRELGQLRQLKTLYLNNNELSGSIPKELGKLKKLEELSLSRNQLLGSIPGELGELSQLKELYLHYNKLSGSIPNEFADLSQLSTLTIYNNCISSQFSNSPILDRITGLDIGSQDRCENFTNRQHIPIVYTTFNLSIDIPLIEVDGQFYSAFLSPFNNSSDEQGLYWKLENIELIDDKTIESQENPAVEFDAESLQLSFNKIHYREQILAATLLHYQNPNDADGFYFQYSPEADTSDPVPNTEEWLVNTHLIEQNCGRGIFIEDVKDTLIFDGEKYYLPALGFELTQYKIISAIDIGLGVIVTEIDFAGNSIPGGKITGGSLVFTSDKDPFVVGSLNSKDGDCSKSWVIGSLSSR